MLYSSTQVQDSHPNHANRESRSICNILAELDVVATKFALLMCFSWRFGSIRFLYFDVNIHFRTSFTVDKLFYIQNCRVFWECPLATFHSSLVLQIYQNILDTSKFSRTFFAIPEKTWNIIIVVATFIAVH